MPLMPNKPVPALELNLAGGGRFSLGAEKPQHFTMVVFYRGLHCPICRRYLSELDGLLPDFEKRGVSVIAASSDRPDRTEQAKSGWGLTNLRVAHGLSIEDARKWGLYVSRSNGTTSAGVVEPDLFNEPGLFIVRPDGTLYWGTTSTMPFGRPHFNEILQSLDFVIPKNYPARGDA
ncbi:MAG: AhpC/TSA family protein [Betaproteobacteria bacterium]|nr:AhpC/TSA family protein [Betaproteobacteria bacterium]